ncbi:ATP-binding protein [Salinibacter ruber]|uniref:ATP-binding protein n=1 Tax=Salinibacter ruber TaxID=146919 RepID=UPI00216A47DC|nr:ATP-binding protein [Salinibacter ruber]MCS3698412.1 PAS domain S-box-containing protein [Salinibacter ruber]
MPLGTPSYLIYLAVFAVAAAGCLVGAWRAYRQVSLPGVRRGLVGLLMASGLWALCHVGVLLSPGIGLKAILYEVGLIVGFGTVWAWLWLCSSYSGRALHRRAGVRWAALIAFAAVTLTKLTNRWHGLYFSAEISAGPFPHLAVDHHVIYWITAGLSYALAAVGFFMLVEPLRRAQVGEKRLAGLFGLTALPLGANAIGYATPYLVDLSHEPVGVAAFALGAFALKRGQLEEASRAGREERPSLVLSADGRIRNYNQAAAELLPALREGTPQEGTPKEGTPQEEKTLQEKEIAGRHLEEALPRLARALEKEKANGEKMNGEITNGEGSGQEALSEDALSEDALNGKMLGEGMPDEETLEVAGAGGEARYYRPVESQAGRGAGRLVVLQDVTERELRRRERASRLEAISDSMPGLAFEFRAGPGGKRSVEFIGEEAEAFLGFSQEPENSHRRFPYSRLVEHVPEGHREEFRQSVDSAVEGRSSWQHEFPFDRPGGKRIWLFGSSEPSAESGLEGEEVVFWGTLADITGRKRREQELKESRRELRKEKRRAESITENVSDGIYRSTEKGIVYANSAFIEMFGYRDLEELREAGSEALYVDPSRREELIEKEHRDGRLRQEEVRYRRKDGTVFVGLLSSQQVEGEEEGKTYFDGAITDITERKEREEALREAKEEAERSRKEAEEARREAEKAKEEAEEARQEAEEASRLKSALLANMSHEIRTPLTSIIGFAEMVGSEASELELPESPLPRYASVIEQSGKRLLETLNGVLNLSKLQAGQMEMEAGPTCLPEQARLAAEELRPEAEEKGIGLELETGGGPDATAKADIVANADEGGVQIVLRNLLSNAIKYTDEGEVTVRTYQDENGQSENGQSENVQSENGLAAVLEVEDTGIGMDPEVAEGLFEPFRQASEGLSREYEGTGIGLAVTREAVAQMGGSIEVETQKGQGTCMTVRLPLAGETEAA